MLGFGLFLILDWVYVDEGDYIVLEVYVVVNGFGGVEEVNDWFVKYVE